MGGRRVAIRNGRLVPLPHEEWKSMRMEEEFDALLYLGSPGSMTTATIRAALCKDAEFVEKRLERLMLFGPPVEVQKFKSACGLQ
ncbi:MAG: hypothetical protein DMF98_24380 [Acidobacteria bacterium]|nr:MAG: hypothetical protein DMF98_24380 [Acidobacteriota bacterium]